MPEDHSEARVTLWLSEDLKTRVKKEGDMGSSISAWVRESVLLRMTVEAELERRGIDVPDDHEAFEDLIVDLLREGADTRE